MELREATAADLPALGALEREAFGEHGYPAFFFRQALDALGAGLLVAADGSAPLGYALGSLEAGATDAWVLSVAVLPAARGRGVGRALMEALARSLAARGAGTIRLHVAPENRVARRLYASLGYEELELVPDAFGPGEDRLVLRARAGGS